jgi:predicted kinase
MNVNPPLPLPDALLARMDATPQNPRYHREGSVLAHTQYVLQQFQAHQDQFGLTEEEKLVLYWAAVLHDVGKIVTTIWQDERHRSPGHERASLPFAQEILLQHPEISTASRRKILDLVRWHGLPLRFAQTQQPIEVVKKLGTRTDLRLLGIFALCDFWGRDCDDKQEMLAIMGNFKELIVPQVEFELGKYAELEAATMTWNLRHKNAIWNAYKMGDMRLLEKLLPARQTDTLETRGQRVTIVFGPPLAGKTTWLDQHYPDHFRVSLHEHEFTNAMRGNEYLIARKLIELKHLMRVYLNRHQHVVLESRDLDENIRLRLAEVLRDMPVELDYVMVEAGLDEMHDRNLLAASPIENSILSETYHAMELVHPWEAHVIQYVRS